MESDRSDVDAQLWKHVPKHQWNDARKNYLPNWVSLTRGSYVEKKAQKRSQKECRKNHDDFVIEN